MVIVNSQLNPGPRHSAPLERVRHVASGPEVWGAGGIGQLTVTRATTRVINSRRCDAIHNPHPDHPRHPTE